MTPSDPEEPATGDQPGTTGSSSSSEPSPSAASAWRAQLPSDVDAAFAAIVAPWAAEGAPRWPGVIDISERGPDSPGSSGSAEDGPSSGISTATPPTGQPTVDDTPPAGGPIAGPPVPRDASRPAIPPTPPGPPAPRTGPPSGPRDHVAPEGEEHFVPPDPPPLPRLGLSSLAGIGLLVVGVVLLAVPSLLGASIALGIVPGLMAMTAGLGWLVFGMRRPHERDDDGPDGGAVL